MSDSFSSSANSLDFEVDEDGEDILPGNLHSLEDMPPDALLLQGFEPDELPKALVGRSLIVNHQEWEDRINTVMDIFNGQISRQLVQEMMESLQGNQSKVINALMDMQSAQHDG